jgi:hypothetical protein
MKWPGVGEILPDLIKCGTGKLRNMLGRLYEIYINAKHTPEESCKSYTTPTHKKGSQKDPKNYRGTALICNVGRIYSQELRNLIEKKELIPNKLKKILDLGLGGPQQIIFL